MEILDLRNPSSQAKTIGTIVAISGAMVVTLNKGPALITQIPPSNASNKLLSVPSNWTIGDILLAVSSLLSSTDNRQYSSVTYKPLSIIIAMIIGLAFLGDSLYLGSIIGTAAITVGFYTVIWGQAREKDVTAANNVSRLESISDKNVPLLKSSDDKICGSS